MEVTRPRLLVVGDSFFSRDSAFPGLHWSEMLHDYDVDNRATPGNSISMILHDLVEGLAAGADAVVIGFTGPGRIEFKNTTVGHLNQTWITSQHQQLLTSDQKLLVTLHQSLTDPVWANFGAFWQIIGALGMLKNQNIPFAYSLGIYQQLIPVTEPLVQYNDLVTAQLARFSSHALVKNLASYPLDLQTAAPIYHVPDHHWQNQFASEVDEKLKTLDI